MSEDLRRCHCGKPLGTTGGNVGPFCEFHNIMSAYEAGFVTVEEMAQRIVNMNSTRAEAEPRHNYPTVKYEHGQNAIELLQEFRIWADTSREDITDPQTIKTVFAYLLTFMGKTKALLAKVGW